MRYPRLIWLLVPSSLLACKCESSFSVCHEFALSGAVFIGTVQSITPTFLDRWNPTQRPSLPLLNEAETRFHQDPSTANLGSLKDTFRKVFPDLSEDYQRRLQAAGTPAELSSLFNSVLDRGKRVHFLVKTVFRGGDDDDDQPDAKKDAKKDPKKDDDDHKPAARKDQDSPRFFDVWTPFSDCGYDFQQGETYLVYADDDEETNILETSRCSRTSRVTDAGADLAYLYFLQNSAEASGRFEGFVTADPYYQLGQDQMHDPEKIVSPVPGTVLELQSDSGSPARYAAADADARFVFDGLATGDYRVTAYASGYPDKIRVLQGPVRVRVETRSCASRIVLVPR